METLLNELREEVLTRTQDWEDAKEPQHITSIFVCNRRIQSLNKALELIDELEEIDAYTKR